MIGATGESPTRYMLPPEEPPKKKRKKSKKVEEDQQPFLGISNMTLVKEEEEFDPDKFLESISQEAQTDQVEEEGPFRNPSPPFYPTCPVHDEALEKREADTQYGRWEYNKCPVQNCFVCCGVDDRIHAPGTKDNVQYYLESIRNQLHFYFRELPLEQMKCFCDKGLILTMSHSEKNPGRLFFKCSKRWCDFFQWADEHPWTKNQAWLEDGIKVWQGHRTGPFQGNWHPDDFSPRTKTDLDRIIHQDQQKKKWNPKEIFRQRERQKKYFQDQYQRYLLDEFTPKEKYYLEERRLQPPSRDSYRCC